MYSSIHPSFIYLSIYNGISKTAVCTVDLVSSNNYKTLQWLGNNRNLLILNLREITDYTDLEIEMRTFS